jgi:hypothetical protein
VSEKTLAEEIEEYEAFVAGLQAQLDRIRQRMGGAAVRIMECKQAIAATHGEKLFSFAGKRDRVPLFAKLDKISEEFGPLRSARRDCFADFNHARHVLVGLRATLKKVSGGLDL